MSEHDHLNVLSEHDHLNVLIAVYLIPDLARQDFRGFVRLVEQKAFSTEGVALVTKNASGEVEVLETGDHLGRKGLKLGAGVGLVIGLFSPPLLAATAVGAALGELGVEFARKRVLTGIREKMDDALPAGSAAVLATFDHRDADSVAKALSNAIRTSTVQIDKASAMELKAGLEKAAAGLAG